jgi:hypothetical protein
MGNAPQRKRKRKTGEADEERDVIGIEDENSLGKTNKLCKGSMYMHSR